jgi:hypothetical protein
VRSNVAGARHNDAKKRAHLLYQSVMRPLFFLAQPTGIVTLNPDRCADVR